MTFPQNQSYVRNHREDTEGHSEKEAMFSQWFSLFISSQIPDNYSEFVVIANSPQADEVENAPTGVQSLRRLPRRSPEGARLAMT